MAPKHLLGHALVLVLSCGWLCRADFTTDFQSVTQGSPLNLEWDDVDPGSYPLIIGVSLINKTEGGSANGFKTDISRTVTNSSFLWQDVPYPARYIPTAMYRVELRPSKWDGDQQPVLARSPYFAIQQSTPETPTHSDPPSSDAPQPAEPDTTSTAGPNSKLAIALGVGIGLPTLVVGGVAGWCCRKRQKRRRKAAQERRWKKRMEFVIS